MTLKIPRSLIAAKDAVEAALAAQAEIAKTLADMRAAGAAALARCAEIDPEIARLHDLLLADDALAGTAEKLRMAGDDRRATALRLAALREEHAGLAEQIERNRAGHNVLGPIAADNAALVEAAETFAKEKRDFVRGLDVAFTRDVGVLPLPQLFQKWSAVASAIGNIELPAQLGGVRLSLGGGVILYGGIFHSAAGVVDWRDFRSNPALVELHRELAAIVALDRRVAPILANDLAQRRAREESERAAARAQYFAENPRPESGYMGRPVPQF